MSRQNHLCCHKINVDFTRVIEAFVCETVLNLPKLVLSLPFYVQSCLKIRIASRAAHGCIFFLSFYFVEKS